MSQQDTKAEVEEALARAQQKRSEEERRIREAAGVTEGEVVTESAADGREVHRVRGEHFEKAWGAEHSGPYQPAVEFGNRVEELAEEIFGEDNFGYAMYVASPKPDGDWEDGGSVMSSRKTPNLSDSHLVNIVMVDIAINVLMGRESPALLLQLLMGGGGIMAEMLERYRDECGYGEEGEDE